MNNDDIENIMTEYRAILAEIDKEWRRLAAWYNFECQKCGSCCKGPVPVSRHFEALLLLEYFNELDEAKKSEILLRSKLYKQAAKRRGYARYPEAPLFGAVLFLNQVASDLRGIACPLLSDENLCTLYKARPIACRAYTCFDEDAFCRNFHVKIKEINELEFRFSIGDMNTMFIADVLLLAEKKRANRDVPNIEFKNRHAPAPRMRYY